MDDFETLVSFDSLLRSARRAAKGKRPSMETMSFMADVESEVLRLERELLLGKYHPSPYRTFKIRDPKPRTISAAAFRDRVVQHALCHHLEPGFERLALPFSFACRPGRGTRAALRFASKLCGSHAFCLKLDIKHFFETLDHMILKRLLRTLCQDLRSRWLTALFIDHGAPGSPNGKGVPIGNLTSQYFSNHYLRPLDQLINRQLCVKGWCRYMDDILLFGDDKSKMWGWHAKVESFLKKRLRLDLRSEVTVLRPTSQGVSFLGMRIFPGLVRLDRARRRRLLRRLKRIDIMVDRGVVAEEDAVRVVQSLLGWSEMANTFKLRTSLRWHV